ncbi:MAG TPA: AbfB domain-containing protein [Bacillota bacterium]|nr:AbfB domain-containing protein [Bacillota bacterium]
MIQSFNLPTHFLRRNGTGVILDSQTDPRLDCQWQIVTGLADTSGESNSFQLVNRPGYYLIQSGNQLAVGRNDGTGAFKKKATFKKVAGLADAGGVSFQSFSSPELYIRHTQNNLQLDPIGSDAQKADATFKIVE